MQEPILKRSQITVEFGREEDRGADSLFTFTDLLYSSIVSSKKSVDIIACSFKLSTLVGFSFNPLSSLPSDELMRRKK